jgi:hypothetical protein
MSGSPDPVLAFRLKKEHKAKMRWVWPFTAPVCEDRENEAKGSRIDDSRPDFLCVGAQKGEHRGFISNSSHILISGCPFKGAALF